MQVYYPDVNATKSAATNYLDRAPANLSDVLAEEFAAGARFGLDALNAVGVRIESAFEDAKLTKEEYENSEFFREGIEVPEGGISLGIAQLSAQAYDRRFARNLTLNRARQDISTGALRFGASLAGSIFDPLNIAAGLVAPVAIGANATARAASARAISGVTNRYGVTAGRVAAGAGEATAGAAFVEPLALYAADLVQDPEYGLYDTFVNLTAGAIFGGTLVGVGGKFSDKLKNARIETLLESSRASIAQAIEGKPVNVDAPIVNNDPIVGPSSLAEQRLADARAWERMNIIARKKGKPKADDYPPALRRAFLLDKKGNPKNPQSITAFVRANGGINATIRGTGEISDLDQRLDNLGFTVKNNKTGLSLEKMAEKAQEAGFFGEENVNFQFGAVDQRKLIPLLEDDIGGRNVYSSTDKDAIEYLEALELAERADRAGVDPLNLTDDEFFERLDINESALSDEELAQMQIVDEGGMPRSEAEALIAREADPDDPSTYIDIYDEEELLAANDELRSGVLAEASIKREASDDSQVAALDKDIENLQNQINALNVNNLILDEEMALFEELDNFIDAYDEFDSIAQAGITCVRNN